MGKLIFYIIICIVSCVITWSAFHSKYKSVNLEIIKTFFILILAISIANTIIVAKEILDAKNDTKLKDEYAILLETLNSYNENIPLDITLVERIQKFNEDYLEYAENVKNENFWTKGLYSKEAIEGLDVIRIENYRD